jgi:peptide/nickel transport system ATP-binding protein
MGLVSVKNLSVDYKTGKESFVMALSGINIEIDPGETIALVGESGCGKSTLASALLKLLPSNAAVEGSVEISGKEILKLDDEGLRGIRGKTAGIIFQDPGASLNPVFTVKQQIEETISAHMGKFTAGELGLKGLRLLEDCGIADSARVYNSYPHQLSGGLQQRVMIAIALSCGPKLLIADEPTTALDVTVQAQIVVLLKKLKVEHDLTSIVITHDLYLAVELAERIIVMYAGEVVEDGCVRDVSGAYHPYTHALFEIIPDLKAQGKKFNVIAGDVPEMSHRENRCWFSSRCPRAQAKCMASHPQIEEMAAGHFARCYFPMK